MSKNCTRNVLIRGSDVTKGRWFGFFTRIATTIMCHLQHPWMCSTLLQQSHECAVVTMSDPLMNFLQPIGDFFFSLTRSDLPQQHVALMTACQHRDQCPSLMVQRPKPAGVFPTGSRRIKWSVIVIGMQLFQNAQRGIPTVFRKKLLCQRLTQRLRKLQ